MAKSAAERRREADAKKRSQGLQRVSVWVPESRVEDLKRYAAKLKPK